MTEPMKAYLAAMLDGEGSIGVVIQKTKGKNADTSHNFVPRLAVTNSHLGLLEFLRESTGVGYVYRNGSTPKNPNWSPVFYWMVAANGCREILTSVVRYLVIKRKQAELVISLPRRVARAHNNMEVYRTQKSIYDQCKLLNQRGVKKQTIDTFPSDHPLLATH